MKLSEATKSKIKDIYSYKFMFIILLVMTIAVYKITTNILIAGSIDNIEEMARHDAKSIEYSLYSKWMALENMPQMLLTQDYKDYAVRSRVCINTARALRANRVALVDVNGHVHYSTGYSEKNMELLNLCQTMEDHFVANYNREDKRIYERNEDEIILGVKIKPIKIGDLSYEYALAFLEKSRLEDLVKMDSFGGKGLTYVVDREGYYIINPTKSANTRKNENVYDDYEGKVEVENYASLDELGDVVVEAEDVTTVRTHSDRGEFVVVFLPMRYADWYMYTVVPLSIYSNASTQIMVLIIALVACIIFLSVHFARRKAVYDRQRLEIIEKHRAEMEVALKRAEKANVAKTIFLNSMSHDIRTPMNAIMGFTALAEQHIENSELVKQDLKKVSDSSKHLLSLINDVLDMSRIESGKVVLKEVPYSLPVMISEICDIMSADFEAKDLNIHTQFENLEHPYVFCDTLRVNQVLLNLLSNSTKYNKDHGSIDIIINETETQSQDFSTYEIIIRDTGIGMSDEYRKTIFEAFTREETSTINGIQGTGLGMSITYNLIKLMGGTIICNSEKDVGSEFIVKLKLRIDKEGLYEQILNQEEISQDNNDIIFEGKRVLLVEDNLLNQEIAVEILSDVGFMVDWAENGQVAIDLINKHDENYYDVVLMDVQMPILNGYEATKLIRKLPNEKKSSILIFAMTANAFEEDKEKALLAGMDGHIAKPIDVSLLMEILKKYFSKK